jgi:Tfp pilus assembly protein PilN
MAKRNQKLPEGSLLKINILPQRYRRKRVKPIAVLPWLFLLILLVLIYPLGRILADETAAYRSRVQEFETVQNAINNYNDRKVEQEALQADLEAAQQELDLFEESFGNLPVDTYRWSALFKQLNDLTPSGITLESMDLQNDRILLTGFSETYQPPLIMVEKIRGLDDISRAELNVIQLQEKSEPDSGLSQDNQAPTAQSEPMIGYQFEINVIPHPRGVNNE